MQSHQQVLVMDQKPIVVGGCQKQKSHPQGTCCTRVTRDTHGTAELITRFFALIGLFRIFSTTRSYIWDSGGRGSTQSPLKCPRALPRSGPGHLYKPQPTRCWLMTVLLGECWQTSEVGLPFPIFWQLKRFETKLHYDATNFSSIWLTKRRPQLPDSSRWLFFISKTNWWPQTFIHVFIVLFKCLISRVFLDCAGK